MTVRTLTLPTLRLGAAILLLCLAARVPALGQPAQDPIRPGERMYRNGLLPSGNPISTTWQGRDSLPGTTFGCAGCHLRAGTGNADEAVAIPPINAAQLFKPSFRYYPDLTPQERAGLPEVARNPLRRPAYTDATLVAAIRDGADPVGRSLNPVMPRYHLDDRAADLLVNYLKSLSLELSPGVTGTTLSFATVITEGVPKADRDAMLATLERQVAEHNQVYEKTLKKVYRVLVMKQMALPMRKWSLVVWELKGSPSQWPAQLEEHYTAGPVFALVGGLSAGDWRPVHEFCEGRGIPCILPLTDYPVISQASGYTLYFTGGFFEEGAAAGAHAADSVQGIGGKPILQIIQDTPASRALARGFQDALAERGVSKAKEVMVPAGGGFSATALSEFLTDSHGEGILALWGGRDAFKALGAVAASADKPALVLMSANILREDVWDLPLDARPFTLLTHPYRLPKAARPGQGSADPVPTPFVANGDARRVRSRAYTLMQVVDEGVRRMSRDFYRDNFLDRIRLMADKTDSDYEILSFSPDRPWLSTGCYLVRIPQDPVRGFVQRSDWIIR